MKSYNETGLFIFFTGLIIAIGRLLFSNTSEEEILILMAVINYIALGFVLLFLHIAILNNCKEKLNRCGFETKQKKSRQFLFNLFSVVLLFLYLIMGTLYVVYIKTTAINDAISIIALSISIASYNFEKILTKVQYKLVNSICSFFENVKRKVVNELSKHKKQEKK